jgi:hypothetical protein
MIKLTMLGVGPRDGGRPGPPLTLIAPDRVERDYVDVVHELLESASPAECVGRSCLWPTAALVVMWSARRLATEQRRVACKFRPV